MSSRSSRRIFIGVSIVALATLLTLAVSASAQSGSSRPLPIRDYVTVGDVATLQASTVKPLAPSGSGDWTFSTIVNAPMGTLGSAAVWTGNEMIVWGGQLSSSITNGGARYSPSTDTWVSISTVGAPTARFGHAAVWTGNEMLVWGGIGFSYNDGGAYNPTTNQWRPITTTNAPPASYNGYKAIWTGHEMLVWGVRIGQGGIYNPSTDSWRSITTTNAPLPVAPGYSPPTLALIWTGDEALAFYSLSETQQTSGGRYNPNTDTWRPMSLVNAPLVESNAAVTWTGREMVVYGGVDADGAPGPNVGAFYNPRNDVWTTIPTGPALEGTTLGKWTGTDVVMLGCSLGSRRSARYDPLAGLWFAIPTGVCTPYTPDVGVWTGNEFLAWGGGGDGAPAAALRYSPPFQSNTVVNASADTYFAQGKPTSAFGSEQLLWSGYDPQFKYYTERALTHFPLTIPTRATVTQAAAYLYLYGYSTGAVPMNMTAYRATAPWNEGSTWQTSSNSYNTALGSTISVGTAFGWYGWDVTNIVKTWQSGTPNYGLMFNGNESGARNERVFIAREAGTTGTAYLSVTYTDPAYAPDTTAPTASLAGQPALQPEAIPLAVRWLGSDVGRGLQSFDVQVSDNGGAWADWYAWAVGTTGTFNGESGHTYCFRVRARDYAGNVGSWSTTSRCTTFYADALIGQVVDQHHAPVVGANLTITPTPIATQLDSLSGQYVAYLTNSQPHQVSVGHLDYALPPTATVDVSTTDRYDVILQPLDNLIQNANFELPLATGWITSGTLPIASSTYRHSGDLAVALNSETVTTDGLATLTQAVTLPVDARPQILSFMYALSTTTPLSQSGLSVTVEFSGTTTSVFTTTTPCLDWCHQWIDLSAWQGQSITLTFTLEQNNGEALQVYLDEVTLGAWLTPFVQEVTPVQVDANTTTDITVTGENFLAEPLVLLNGLPVSTTWLSATTLTATVPSTLTFGIYSVQVQNPSNHRGAWSRRLIVGHQIYLPITNKNAP